MDAPLSVLHLIDTGGPGGAETILRSVVRGLEPLRWTSVPLVPIVDWLYEALAQDGADPILLPDGGGHRHLLRLHRVVRQHRPAVVHAHLLGSAVYGSLAAAPLGIPVICTFHGRPDIPDEGRLLRTKLRILSRARNRIAFVSRSLKEHVLERHALPRERARVVHNGIDAAPPPPTGRERQEMGIERDALLLGAVGNVRPAKDYPNLIRAAALLRDRGLDVRVVVLGEGRGPLLDELHALCRALHVEEAISFLGFRPDARRLLAAFDVFVCSSSSEGFSLSTVEALWAGRPVVATRSGGPEEIVDEGRTGLLVPPRSPDALADAVERLFRGRALAQRLGEAGSRDVRLRFSRDRMVRGYEELYLDALGVQPFRSRNHAHASLVAG